jgi:hypothetical protein
VSDFSARFISRSVLTIQGYALFMLTQVMGWSPEQTRVYAAVFRKQLRDKGCHPYFNWRSVCARKPE